ncbi:CST complex subunit CTC1 isoform X2 [Citrus sinensis]|uniref:CST complex subunit CTC1 isoform X2 n=1 Tax=Citrus sinensis TaxID=2711 RepID=UPI002278C1DF|nr:CST complex subunit CTC1 isoform X2 [Citrus sinensis]
MLEKNVKVLTIAELIHGARPLSGTSFLHPYLDRPISRTSSSNYRTPLGPADSISDSTNPKILTPLNHPVVLIGTLTLHSSHDDCLEFTDSSSEICCDILDFNVRAIGKRIHVSAWNFIPLKSTNGFLEIIKWNFPESTSVLHGCSSTDSFDSFPLFQSSVAASEIDHSKSRYRFHGAIESVSPVSIVPCSRPCSSNDSANIRGFLMRVLACDCKFCTAKECEITHECHSFTKPKFVYFFGAASCWHPVATKLVGKVITISGLKKKLVFIGKEESQLMFVTTENSVLHVPRLLKKWSPPSKTVIKGKGESGVYTGVVKGVYMQGLLVELDNEVWLLLTDKLRTVPHSLRSGAVISVRNVHFVNPRFSWTKILILGACCKTSIIVESFSPLESGALLVVTCFQKKFSGILLDKEILGSKHKKGLAQMYCSSHLPSSVIRARHGMFTELCKHESCGCGSEPYCGNLRLVAPISSFIYHCEATGIKMLLEFDNECHLSFKNNRYILLSSEGEYYGRSKRQIVPSEDIGIVLLGSLKISPSSGRLQLVDMTGTIDVIIPDLSLTWENSSIFEIIDYTLMMEGLPEVADRLWLPKNVSFSCKAIFNCAPLSRKRNLSTFVYFHMCNSPNNYLPFYPCAGWTNDFKELESGMFHLIQVTHKFPLLQKFEGDPLVLNRSSMFVEAIVLPCNLVLYGKDGTEHPTKVLGGLPNELVKHCTGENYRGYVPEKRCKSNYKSGRAVSSGLMDDLAFVECELSTCFQWESSKERKHTHFEMSHEIPCKAAVRSANNQSLVLPAILCRIKANLNSNVTFQCLTAEKILLEFNSESFLKYQLLQIGGYYIFKHHIENCFCTTKDSENVGNAKIPAKIPVSSKTRMWSLTFSTDEVVTYNRSPSNGDSSFSSHEALAVDQVELLLHGLSDSYLGKSSDVHLFLSANAKDILKVKLKDLEEDFIKPSVGPDQTSNISSCTRTTLNVPGLSYGPLDSSFLVPEGNLISLHGDVVAVHGFDDSSVSEHLSGESLSDVLQFGFFQELGKTFCIHVLVDHKPVRIFGSLSEHVYLIGFGPGVNATFHRILPARVPDSFTLLSISFIVVNSIRVVNNPFIDKISNLWSNSDMCNKASPDTVSSGLISELVQCSDCKPMRLYCRVVSVHVLILEQKNRKCDSLHSKPHSRAHLVDIPLACFVLDDGSSSCYCWANAEQAATFLRLHDELPQSALENSGLTLKWIGIDNNGWTTTMYHLERIVKKHDRITVKNYGSAADSCYQDLTVSVSSENVLTSSDENLLKLIIYNACFGSLWTVVASVMDLSAVRWLEKEHLMNTEMTMNSMQNICATEVYHTNPITEARNVIQELQDR